MFQKDLISILPSIFYYYCLLSMVIPPQFFEFSRIIYSKQLQMFTKKPACISKTVHLD